MSPSLFSLNKRTSLKSIDQLLDRVIRADCVLAMPGMPAECINLVVTDPPYLVNYHPRDGRRCSGDKDDYWLKPAFQQIYRLLKPNSFCVSFYGWPWVDRFMSAWKECGFRPVSHLTWVKSHCSRRGYTESFHEVGFLLAKGKPPKPQRVLPDVLPWRYTGNPLHPNQKPVIALTPVIKAFSRPGDIVLDPFCGSGTTGVAARDCGRRFIMFDKAWRCYKTASDRVN
jgi:adenine-specific DNA-methyltransferase